MDDTIRIGVLIDFNGCTRCRHLLIEEVDYDFFIKEDDSGIAVPEGREPPMIICARDYPKIISAPLGPKCSDYVRDR